MTSLIIVAVNAMFVGERYISLQRPTAGPSASSLSSSVVSQAGIHPMLLLLNFLVAKKASSAANTKSTSHRLKNHSPLPAI